MHDSYIFLVGEAEQATGEKFCELCQKQVLAANFVTHQARCSRLHSNSEATDPVTSSKCTHPKSLKSKKKDSAGHVPKVDDGDDLDSMLAELSLSDTRCKFKSCKKSVTLLSQRCSFCNSRFCMAHGIPEVHGCEAAAKRCARHGASRQGSGEPKSKKALDPNKRAHLQRRLDKKIQEALDERHAKRAEK